jgi:hypothetical protein
MAAKDKAEEMRAKGTAPGASAVALADLSAGVKTAALSSITGSITGSFGGGLECLGQRQPGCHQPDRRGFGRSYVPSVERHVDELSARGTRIEEAAGRPAGLDLRSVQAAGS